MPLANLASAQLSYIDIPARDSGSTANEGADAPIIVLLHGFASSIKDNWQDTEWISFLNELGLRVIALDNRGHGNSQKFHSKDAYSLELMVQDTIELLNYLKIPKAHIMGYSMGARIAAMLAIIHPDRAQKLVLGGNGYGMIEGNGDWNPVREGLLADSIDDVTDLRARAFRRFAERTRSDRVALAYCVMGLRMTFSENDFRSIKNKVLVAIGTKDDLAGSGQKLVNLMDNAQFFPIVDRDHMRASTDKTFKQETARFLFDDVQASSNR